MGKDKETLAARIDELSRAAEERDQARNEITTMREQLQKAEEAGKDKETLTARIDELSRAAEERDQARREYAQLREQFETVRQENARLAEKKIVSDETPAGSSGELETLRRQAEAHD